MTCAAGRALAIAACLLAASGCGGEPAPPPVAGRPEPPALGEPARALPLPPPTPADLCAEIVNQRRRSLGLPALIQSSALEAYAQAAAAHDASARQAHRYFRSTGGGGLAVAENEIPWWPLPASRSVEDVIGDGISMMWSEGPGGGHYDNLAGPHTAIGCGVFVDDDRVTVVQAFR